MRKAYREAVYYAALYDDQASRYIDYDQIFMRELQQIPTCFKKTDFF